MYYTLKYILIVSLIYSGYNIQQKTNQGNYKYSYWLASSLGLIVYALVEGLRYGRGVDYMSYMSMIQSPYDAKYLGVEYVFISLNKFLHYFNFHYSLVFFIYSFLLMWSCLFLLKERREFALFVLPLFYITTIEQSENLVRHYFAYSFLLISLKYVVNKNYLKSIIFIVLGVFSHYSLLIILPFLALFVFVKNPFINVYVILALYILSNMYIVPVEKLNELLLILNSNVSADIYSNYLNSTSHWLLGLGLQGSSEIMSGWYYLRIYLVPFIVLYFGYRILDEYRDSGFSIYYHLYFIGTIFLPIARSAPTELLYRLSMYFTTFFYIVLGVILYDMMIRYVKLSLMERFVFAYLVVDQLYLISKTIYIYGDVGTLFIWDI